MRRPFRSSPFLRIFCLFFVTALLLLSGCGKMRGWLSHHRSGRAFLSVAQRASDWFSFDWMDRNDPHSVTITWVASKSRVAGYNVYRESQHGGTVKLTVQIIPGTQYTDTTVRAGQTYSYYVTSVDFKGLESIPSEEIAVTVPRKVTPPAKE